ncbi:TadE/TadG family type IV pilus assembly protein [Streptomyces sp. NPDC003077]|uniref:TadE/TadG family type IV pilus assembly protein n=1 Tax=Streptomyces sp. NPDC003077 TaxID=3154443 RepID=UPI0033B9E591
MARPHPSAHRRTRPRTRAPAPVGRGDRGAGTTELVIATPLLLLLLLLVVQFALVWHAQHIAQTAASRALALTRTEGGSADAGRAQAASTLRALGRSVLLDPQVTVARTRRSATVDVRGRTQPVVPGLGLPVSAHAAGVIDRWTTPTGRR